MMSSIILIFSVIVLDIASVKGFKRAFPRFCDRRRRVLQIAFVVQVSVALAILLFGLFQKRIGDYRLIALYFYFFGGLAVIYLPKGVYAMFLVVDKFILKNLKIAKYGLWASVPFALLVVWGIFFGRYNFMVEHVEVTAEKLPQSFDGYKIVQLSDIHAGSFAGKTHRFQIIVELINEQNPNLIVFTGDIVNNFAEELTAFIPIFSQTNAADGKYAVLGNHDYGGYYRWKNSADSVANQEGIKNAVEQMGFVMLINEAVEIESSALERIALIGSENWGKLKRFPKRADLKKSIEPVNDIPFKILLTHDPQIWTKEVEGKIDVTLTLAGHTHGMQMGIKTGNKRYSPACLLPRFRRWGGLYKSGDQYLYVNTGLGVIGLPARMGMSPEITVITLRK